ncbi:p-loop containing nucleoside triphosphate hydrolase protein [Mycena venus]|uniref:p-loop containing nucleoside triphosphate hydrolase protein n=1 Tax=Mycena venus TaxID=2733690 RepID=A0A8H6U460_9AGAR|nr:p-loop containing nucleoside triphosphate hydrolase protein [Mycena venus]
MTSSFSAQDDDELAFLETATSIEQDNDETFLHHQLVTSPLITYAALKHHMSDFPSRGLLGTSAGDRVYLNTNAPSSAVICGVQGSGKSHTVSCILESALIADSRVGRLPEPLSALVFHFDAQDAGRPCEAAFLASPATHHAALPHITVLCSHSNLNRRQRAYAALDHVDVEPLYLSEKDLTADRMLAIMGCDNIDTMPLYMHTALLIIRNMGVDTFSYPEFKRRIALERLNPMQKAMIKLRMDLLDAFIHPGARGIESYFTAGGLVLVDLTDPFLDGVTAAVLFDIVLGAFTQWQTVCGKLVVLDEAHKYLVNSETARLTQSISNTIRLQRHLAIRVIIATQEPTVIPATILDLASIIICHRFSSPAWCSHLARHVSASTESADWYQQVMLLATGEALVFSPAAVIMADERGAIGLLGRDHIKLRMRPRLTLDGGVSLLAVGRSLPASSGGSTASPLSLPTPPTTEFDHPVQREAPFRYIPTTPLAAPNPIVASATPFAPPGSQAAFSTSDPSVATPSALSVLESTTSTPRVYPGSLKHLVGWLMRSGAADAPVKLNDAKSALKSLGLNVKGKLWTQMLKKAVDAGLIGLINKNVTKKMLKARGEAKMIYLLHRGPFVYDT